MHATEFLKKPTDALPVVVLFGADRHLKLSVQALLVRQILGDEEDDELNLCRFSGNDTEMKTIGDELRMVSMWGDRRVVVVESADDFVSKNRPALEKYVEKPASKSVLILDVKKFQKNTKLAKKVTKTGLAIECAELSGKKLTTYLVNRALDKFGKQLSADAAALMVDLAGTQLGLLEQELTKLATYVGENSRIAPDDVRTLVGGWRAETTWTMINAVRDGNLNVAYDCLDKLLIAGEAPQRIMGGINFVFRKLAKATENAHSGMALAAALRKAGVFPYEVDAAGKYLRRIGRPQAEKLLSRMIKADTDLKGGTRIPERLQLEYLLLLLSGRGVTL